MYTAVIVLLVGLAALLVFRGLKRGRRTLVGAGVGVALGALFFFSLLDLWGEFLWFEALGYGERFWTALGAEAVTASVGAGFGALLLALLTVSLGRERRRVRGVAVAAGAVVGGLWGLGAWETALQYANRVSAGLEDPVFGMDTGFYLFALPFYDAVYTLLMLLALLALTAGVFVTFVRIRDGQVELAEHAGERPEETDRRLGPVRLGLAAVLVVYAAGKVLDCYHLMYSEWGAVTGPGWTDLHVRLPGYFVLAVCCLLAACTLVTGPVRRWALGRMTAVRRLPRERVHPVLLGGAVAVPALVWFLALQVAPGAFQWLRVEPNEITLERPYIEHNIRFTRHGYKLHEIEEREFVASEKLTRGMVEQNPGIFSNIRLWDWRALDAVYKQFQEIRLYYEFVDVDIDRYTIGEAYRQVMVSAREMEVENLPAQSRTFVNRRFKYTHGNGITLTTVHDFTDEGLPNLLVRDIPPKSTVPSLGVEQPRIYYGELTDEHVLVNTEEKEFDYPQGERNVYVRYGGDGGVRLGGLWRKFLYGWKFDGTSLLLSGYPTKESRIQFHREVRERVETLAPFLHVDEDPYIVLVDGRLYWIVDAYTTSADYPYSEPFSVGGTLAYKATGRRRVRGLAMPARFSGLGSLNYIRNSVKAVVDAYHGTVHLYVYDEADAIVRVWRRVYPGLFRDRDAMPEGLRAHVRYPGNMLLIQGLTYAKYHMTDPAVFYNQEDLWVRATEKYYQAVQPVEPYYVIWELPDSDTPEFVLILPFTPKNRQVLIGWIAGMCDPGNYGRVLAYQFPKEKRVLGPQQVETKIDQDRFLSGQLTLWDQRGSNVIRGNVLAIPVGDTLLYVEPIYLQAETAAYPELRLVAVMHGDALSYAESFDKALEGLLTGKAGEAKGPGGEGRAPVSFRATVKQAGQAFESYLEHLGAKRFEAASESLLELQSALEELTRVAAPQGRDGGG